MSTFFKDTPAVLRRLASLSTLAFLVPDSPLKRWWASNPDVFAQEQCFLDRLGNFTSLTDVVFPSGNHWRAWVDIGTDVVRWEPATLGSTSFDDAAASFLEHWWWSSDASAGLVEVAPPFVLSSRRPTGVMPPQPWKTSPCSTPRSGSPMLHSVSSRSSTPVPTHVEDIIVLSHRHRDHISDGESDDTDDDEDEDCELQLFEGDRLDTNVSMDDPHLQLELEFDLDAELAKHVGLHAVTIGNDDDILVDDDDDDDEEYESVSPPRPSNPTSALTMEDVSSLFSMSDDEDDFEPISVSSWSMGSQRGSEAMEHEMEMIPGCHSLYHAELNPAKRRMAIYL